MFPDQKHAFVVGGGEGLIRIYDMNTGKLRSKAAAPGFKAWGRDTFALWPSDESPLGALVIYAGLSGQLPERLPDELPVGVTTLRLSEDQAQVLLQAAATALALPQPVERDRAQPIAEPSH